MIDPNWTQWVILFSYGERGETQRVYGSFDSQEDAANHIAEIWDEDDSDPWSGPWLSVIPVQSLPELFRDTVDFLA